MLQQESSLARRDKLEILGKWYTTLTVRTERKFPTKISGIFFVNGEQPKYVTGFSSVNTVRHKRGT